MSDKIEYQNRVVFFFDILGFRDLIEKESNTKGFDCTDIFQLFDFIKKFYQDEIDDKYSATKQITFFSDCVIISFVENEIDQVFKTVCDIQILLVNLILKGIVMRGAISYGKLFHDENYLFGPAFIEAYLIEKDKAKNPRIVCDNSILVLSQKGKSLNSAKQDLEVFTEIVKKDEDGFWYIDYIDGIQSLFNDNYEHINYLITLRKFIVDRINVAAIPSVKEKYLWMKSKFNSIAESIIENNKAGNIKDVELSNYINGLTIIE